LDLVRNVLESLLFAVRQNLANVSFATNDFPDLPPVYAAYRERLLKLAYAFAKLEEPIREQYADSHSRYRCARLNIYVWSLNINEKFSFGWSHGKVCIMAWYFISPWSPSYRKL
jgi:hypothetical protein